MKVGTRYQIIFFSVLILTLSIAFTSQNVFAGELSPTNLAGTKILDFRNLSDLSTHPVSVMSLDQSSYLVGGTAIITLNDANANLNTTAIDFAHAIVGGSSLTLTESAADSDVFSGSFIVTNPFPTIEYTGDSSQAARAKVTLPLSSGGGVILSDLPFTTSDSNIQVRATTAPLNVILTSGASFTSTKPTIVLSFANALYPAGVDLNALGSGLEMWHKAVGEDWEIVTQSCDTNIAIPVACTFYNLAAKTITSDPNGGGFGTSDGQGQYILGYDTGVPGGGGGGLVSPGLVVNALAGIRGPGGSSGSGGSAPLTSINQLVISSIIDVPEEIEQMVLNHDSYAPLLPMDPDSFEDFDFPLVINDQGFVLGGFTSTLQTQIIKTNTPITMTFTVYETEKIQHFSLYTNLLDTNDSIAKSDTQILYNDGKDLTIIDPNGFFTDAKITILEEEDSIIKYVIVEMTFAKEMDTSHIITRSWDPNLYSRDTHILDAIKIIPEEPEFVPIPQATEEVQVEELTSKVIPKWVKSNAEWWVDDQIDDQSFVAGIQYLINNGIMYIPNTETVNSSVTEIPDWVKNNAEWWADNHISDDDFVNAMEWLVINGVISIG